MSHVSVVNKVPVKDRLALEAAVDELRKEQGVNIRMVEGGNPRLYYPEQTAAYKDKCAYTLLLPDAQFDIGLVEVKDENKNFVRYDLITDFHAGSVSNQIGHKAQKGEEVKDGFKMGKLMKAYSKYAIHNLCLQSGRDLSELLVAENGEIHIKVKIPA